MIMVSHNQTNSLVHIAGVNSVRKILIGVAALIVIVAIAVFVLFSNLEGIIKTAIEDNGSDVTQSTVSLDAVELNITSGSGGLKGLVVGNPAGFEQSSIFELGVISMKVDIAKSDKQLIIINEILIDQPVITYELSETTNNVDVLRKNVDDYLTKKGLKGGNKAKKDGDEGPKIIIENLYIKNGKLKVFSPILGGKELGGNLPNIHMKDIGKKDGGASPEVVAAEIIDKLTASAMNVVTDLGIGKTLGELTDGLGKLGGKASDDAGKALDKAGDAVKSIFK